MKRQDKTKDELIEEVELLQKRLAETRGVYGGSDELQALLDVYPEGAYIVNEQYDIEYINPVIKKELGEVKDRRCFEYFHDRKEPCPWCQNQKVFSRQLVRWEWTSVKNNKTYSLIDLPLIRKDGSTSKLEIFQDITERRKVEEALRGSETRLASAMKIARLGHWELDVESRMFTFSDSFYFIFRTDAEEMGGYRMSIADYARRFVHPEDAAMVEAETRKAVEATDANFNHYLEHRMLYSDGSVGHIAVHYFVIKDGSGKTIKTYGVNQDISERKKAEEEVANAAREWQRTFDAAADVIFLLDKDHTIRRANKAFYDAFHMRPEDVIGRKCHELVHKSDFPWKTCPHKMTMQDSQTHTEEVIDPVIGRPLSVSTSPIFDDRCRCTGSVHVARDITQIKDAEKELREKIRQLEVFNKAAVGREKRIIELKRQIQELEKKLNG